ncbi:unnamed protein product [Lymnaea stagnalis]|uniref:SAM domain-containing protein n=1 Tax=Lymnaea stagnalis TaxID=6523 RepID=A0AAV2IJK2_LYMST
MADYFNTPGPVKPSAPYINGNHSRQSSLGSGYSHGSNKESDVSGEFSSDNASESQVILRDGGDLTGESRTEVTASSFVYENVGLNTEKKDLSVLPNRPLNKTLSAAPPGTAKAKAAKSPYSTIPSTIPEEEITIPNDANISNFTCDQLANFLRCLKTDERIISHLHAKSIDGKRFAKLRDSELENLGMKNAVVLFFREKSNVKVKRKGPFML